MNIIGLPKSDIKKLAAWAANQISPNDALMPKEVDVLWTLQHMSGSRALKAALIDWDAE